MDNNARRRLRYIEKKIDAFVADGPESDDIRRQVAEAPVDETRTAALWRILREAQTQIAPGHYRLSLIDCPGIGKAVYLNDCLADEGRLGRPGSGKTSGSGREPFWEQMRERYENAAVAAGVVMPEPLPDPLDEAYLREVRSHSPSIFAAQSEAAYRELLVGEGD